MFLRSINWKKFLKWLISLPLIFIVSNLINPNPTWSIVPIITILWFFILFISAHSQYIMKIKPKIKLLSTKQLRLLKLKKINRKRLWKV